MTRIALSVLFILIFGAVCLMADPQAKLNEAAPDFTLKAADGESYTLSDFKGKIVVLEWINFGCPFVKKHYDSGNMQKLQTAYTDKDVVWLAVCSSAEGKQGHMAIDEIPAELKSHNFNANAYLIDEEGKVGMMYDAKTTPHMYVINKEGTLVYMGAIDDKATARLSDIKTANNYVSETLDVLLAGKQPKAKSTKPYGCSVKYK